MCGFPGAGPIVIGCIAVGGGLGLCMYSVYFARLRGNPLLWISALGSLLFVAGVVGQRAYYFTTAQTSSGCTKTVAAHPGIWDASIGIPLTSLYIDLVSMVGALLVVLTGCLMLFFERVGDPDVVAPPSFEALEERDAV